MATLRTVHDRTRLVLQRRIDAGSMSLKLLSAKTGISVSHLCLYLHGHKSLSLDALDTVLRALGFGVEALPL